MSRLSQQRWSQNGAYRRVFWEFDHRRWPNWWKLSDCEIRKLLRQWSWRRPK